MANYLSTINAGSNTFQDFNVTQQDIEHITDFPVYDSRRAGMYTRKQLKTFWDNIIYNTASTSILKQIPELFSKMGFL